MTQLNQCLISLPTQVQQLPITTVMFFLQNFNPCFFTQVFFITTDFLWLSSAVLISTIQSSCPVKNVLARIKLKHVENILLWGGFLPFFFSSSVAQPVDAAEFVTAGEIRNKRYVYLIQISRHSGGLLWSLSLLKPVFLPFLSCTLCLQSSLI